MVVICFPGDDGGGGDGKHTRENKVADGGYSGEGSL